MTPERMSLDELRRRPTITVEQAARVLGVSREAAYQAVRERRIPAIRVSARRIVVPVPALLRLLEGGDAAA